VDKPLVTLSYYSELFINGWIEGYVMTSYDYMLSWIVGEAVISYHSPEGTEENKYLH
jgi:hypothetical protein